jgi:serine/threonine-protein kinase
MRDPLIGLRFYDFIVERKLAEGGMGAVYLLQHEHFPIRKVLKVILAQYANNPAIRERFEREAHAVASLKHPNIAKIDSVGTIEGQPCMLIPFLEGQPLDAYLAARGQRIRAHEALHIATQIAIGLHYAHGKNIIHRDLKPGNVFVEPTDDDHQAIQVLDFGIAKQLNTTPPRSSGTMSGPLGTPEYMAVEQFEHAADVTPAADVWALAIMLWEMQTARRPWTATDTHVLYHKQLTEPPDPPPPGMLLPAWESILRKALCPSPRLRPQSMPELIVPLALALPPNPPHELGGVEVLKRKAASWLDIYAPGASTNPLSSPPPMVPVWTPGVAATPTTLGSSAGVVSSRSAAVTRRKRVLIGTAGGVLLVAGIVAIAALGSGDRKEAARRTHVEPNASGSAQAEPSSTLPPTSPVKNDVHPSAATLQPAVLQRQPASVVPSQPVDSPSPAPHVPTTDDAPPGRVPPEPSTPITPSLQQVPSASRASQTSHPPGGTPRSAIQPHSGANVSKATTTANPAATSRSNPGTPSLPPRAKAASSPVPGQGSDQDFDPNAVAGKREE